MLRTIFRVVPVTRNCVANLFAQTARQDVQKIIQPTVGYHSLTTIQKPSVNFPAPHQENDKTLLNNKEILNIYLNINRPLTKFSLRKGKRKSVKAVIKRFYRLDWGIWIRTKAGRHKKMWQKSSSRRSRLRRHVFVNSTQSWLLDKMVTKFWKKPKYFVDDPYEPYHQREEFYITRRKPL